MYSAFPSFTPSERSTMVMKVSNIRMCVIPLKKQKKPHLHIVNIWSFYRNVTGVIILSEFQRHGYYWSAGFQKCNQWNSCPWSIKIHSGSYCFHGHRTINLFPRVWEPFFFFLFLEFICSFVFCYMLCCFF